MITFSREDLFMLYEALDNTIEAEQSALKDIDEEDGEYTEISDRIRVNQELMGRIEVELNGGTL